MPTVSARIGRWETAMEAQLEPPTPKRFAQRAFLVAALLYMGFIYRISSRTGTEVGPPSAIGRILDAIPHSDKALHLGVYALLGYLLARGLTSFGWAWGIAALYGISDELHQSYVPGREADVFDWMADAVGSWLGALVATRSLLLKALQKLKIVRR